MFQIQNVLSLKCPSSTPILFQPFWKCPEMKLGLFEIGNTSELLGTFLESGDHHYGAVVYRLVTFLLLSVEYIIDGLKVPEI